MSKLADARHHKLLFLLYKMAGMGILKKPVTISTRSLASRVGFSQQSISRYLRELEELGMIKRKISGKGEVVSITEDGLEELTSLRHQLELLLEPSKFLEMEGSLFTGLKEGAYYVSQEGYRKQFLDKLGFDPYFGTLNLKLTSIENRLKLDTLPYIRIEGFESEGRTFGPARCYEAIVNDTEKGAVIVALRSHYDPSVIEVISPIYLRDRFKLKDGDIVKVKIPISKGR